MHAYGNGKLSPLHYWWAKITRNHFQKTLLSNHVPSVASNYDEVQEYDNICPQNHPYAIQVSFSSYKLLRNIASYLHTIISQYEKSVESFMYIEDNTISVSRLPFNHFLTRVFDCQYILDLQDQIYSHKKGRIMSSLKLILAIKQLMTNHLLYMHNKSVWCAVIFKHKIIYQYIAVTAKRLFSFELLKAKKVFFVSYSC